MKKSHLGTFLGQALVLSVVFGILQILFVIVQGFSLIGDEALTEDQIENNSIISDIVGFPASLFIDGFPLTGKDYFDYYTNGILPINLFLQACIVILLVKSIHKYLNKASE